jgi:exodeoxyribonuclease V beta subunit
MEFHMAAPRVATAELAELVRGHGYPCKEMPRQVLEGYLHGFIDLVVEHQGKFHIVDWKSNHLGYTPQDYGQKQLQASMDDAGYHLQYLLYTIAVHRWLQRKLPGYDYEQHFGGVHYLFVRGVRPQWGAAGVYTRRPELALVRELEALFGRAQGERQ